MKNKIQKFTLFVGLLLLIISIKNISFAANYIDGRDHGTTKKLEESGRTYTQKTTGTAEAIFNDLAGDNKAKYLSTYGAQDVELASTLQCAFDQSLKQTEVMYCVNQGAHIKSSERWIYHITGYIEISQVGVTVYKNNKNNTDPTVSTYTDQSVIQIGQYLAAALAINGPFGGYTESGTVADGNATSSNSQASKLGYGELDNYTDAQQMVYYYWNASSFLNNIGCVDWKHDSASVNEELKNNFERSVDEGEKTYTAQIVYLDGGNPVYWTDDSGEIHVKEKWSAEEKGLQQLIMAQAEGDLDGKTPGQSGFKLVIKKKWDLNGYSSDKVTIPSAIVISIYKKSTNTFIGTTTVTKTTNEETGETEYVGSYEGLEGNIDDYEFKESSSENWTLSGDVEKLDDNDETAGKYGNRYPNEKEENANAAQKKIAEIAKSAAEKKERYGLDSGWCVNWVQKIYNAAGQKYQSQMKTARNAGKISGISSDFSFVPIGAVVYGYGRTKDSNGTASSFGHCGIYIGNGKVAHYASSPTISSLEDWVATYNGACWGWCGGSGYEINSKFTKCGYALMDNINATETSTSFTRAQLSFDDINNWTKANLGHEFSTDIGTGKIITIQLTNKYTQRKDEGESGIIKISGKVFLDADSNKAGVSTNGICDDTDQGIGDIKVTWRTKSGLIISSTKTAADGTYSMETYVNLWLRGWDYLSSSVLNSIGNIASILLSGDIRNVGNSDFYYFVKERFNEINESYVEFEYNGLQYTTSKVPDNAVATAGASKAKTSDIDRLLLDNKFTEVTHSGVESTSGILTTIQTIINNFGSIQNYIEQITSKNDDDYFGANNDDVNSAVNGLGDTDNINLDFFGLKGENDKYNNNKNNQNGTYQNMLGQLKFGNLISELVESLNNMSDSAGVQNVLDLLDKYLKIKSQEEGSFNQILDIFNLKSTIDRIEDFAGKNETFNIKYETDSSGNAIAQLNETDLNKFTIKASTKNVITKNNGLLTNYTFMKSEKHTHRTAFCDAPNTKNSENGPQEYDGVLSNEYSNIAVMFEENITAHKKDPHYHTTISSISDYLTSKKQNALIDKLGSLAHFMIANPKKSKGTIYADHKFKKEDLTKFNSHLVDCFDAYDFENDGFPFIVNCNGFHFSSGYNDLITAAVDLATAKKTLILHIPIPGTGWNIDAFDYTTSNKIAHAYQKKQMTDSWVITNVNCGLVLREQPDAKTYSDILQAKVIMKGQEYTYKYNSRNYDIIDAIDTIKAGAYALNLPMQDSNGNELLSTDTVNKMKLLAESINGQYTRKINPSDIAYVSNNVSNRTVENDQNKNSFEIYVTYWVRVGNQSNTLPMRINEIVNYYENDCYTYSDDYVAYVDENGRAYTNKDYGWRQGTIAGVDTTGGYSCVSTSIIAGNKGENYILPAKKSDKVPLTYKVNLTDGDNGTVKELMLKRKLLINNISEITSYTTRYGLNTMCLNGGMALTHPWMLLSTYAGVDKDSKPGNAIMNVKDGISAILKEHGINTDVSDKVDDLTESLMQQKGDGSTIDFVKQKLTEFGVPDQISSMINKVIGSSIESVLNEMAKQITDITGVNIYNLLQKIEDDTSMAPLFKLELPDENYRTISGVVFEDLDENTTDNERLGDGKYDSAKEKGVNGVRVELHRTDIDGNDLGIATLYGIDGNGNSVVLEGVTYTSNGGQYSFGANDGNTPNGIIEDYYKLYYIYGDANQEVREYVIDPDGSKQVTMANQNVDINSTINGNTIDGRNYKSTIITDNLVKDVFNGQNQLNKDNWHMVITGNGYSVARDWLEKINDQYTQRKEITENYLQYSNFEQKYNMTSYTNLFRLGIEYTVDNNGNEIQNQQVDNKGNAKDIEFTTNIKLNFGIIERPRENIIIDKTISNIRLIFANGQVLFDGDPYSGELPYLIALGPKEIRANSNTRDRLIRIEIDTELMQSAELQITYTISVTNNSEMDYDTENYYYYGIQGTPDQIVTGCVPLLIDYLDFECEFIRDNQENQDYGWEVKSVDDFENLIDEENVKKAIEAGKYTILTTEYFKNVGIKETKSAKLYVTKLFSTKTDEYTFENHTEILQIDGNRARTIKEVEQNTRKQVTKEYKPGNYIPSTATRNDWKTDNVAHIAKDGMHEKDDDRIIIRMTPPTGTITRKGYTAIMIVSLLIIGMGAFVIKKKVLKK